MLLKFGLLCERVMVDSDNNQTHIVGVLEEITIAQVSRDDPGLLEDIPMIPFSCVFLALFEAETEEEKQTGVPVTLRLVRGDKALPEVVAKIEFNGKPRSRMRATFGGIPFFGPGEYEVQLDYPSKSGPKRFIYSYLLKVDESLIQTPAQEPTS